MLDSFYQLLPNYQQFLERLIFSILPKLVHYQQNLPLSSVWKKSDGSFVTSADYGVQFLIQQQLAQKTPGIPLVCEENYHDLPEEKLLSIYNFATQCTTKASPELITEVLSQKHPSIEDSFWLIDPIDGTSGFIRNQAFSVAISLVINKEPLLSVIACSDPTTRLLNPHQPYQVFSARKNHGSFSLSFSGGSIERKRIHTAQAYTCKFCEASMSTYNQQHQTTRQLSEQLLSRPQPVRLDSQSKYTYVASGKVDFFLRVPYVQVQAKPWDHIPGSLLTAEAGGIVSDLLGRPLTIRNSLCLENNATIVASSRPNVHEEVLTKLSAIYPEGTI
ncbi:inositol monophosphatase family protein [Chlamydiifrater phoenicopteri]|uniref:inositol monophosphatase family protein n=1 Tax=Chlamydiifrater phoenicopteri TaxID=2681469 RepID=UPI001BCDA653|nr:inositol monophosphatase family protein [Chlamydiifrater phoenicopteri]